MRPLRILTWHVHGKYLYYLSHLPHILLLPVRDGHPTGYSGRAGTLPWPDNVQEFPAERASELDIDVIVFQSRRNYLEDQFELLSNEQRSVPKVYVEHDPPREHPTDARHVVEDLATLVVHVTHFNKLMWDNSGPTSVIEHGVTIPREASYKGTINKGIVVVNGLDWRGRRVGADVVDDLRGLVPLDIVGMGSEKLGGLGEIDPSALPQFMASYRFFLNPIRYTSLGLAVCEAMLVGMPVVGLATTEMVTAVTNGVTGWVDTNPRALVEPMRRLLEDPAEAGRMGREARRHAERRFGIKRFVADWERALAGVASGSDPRR